MGPKPEVMTGLCWLTRWLGFNLCTPVQYYLGLCYCYITFIVITTQLHSSFLLGLVWDDLCVFCSPDSEVAEVCFNRNTRGDQFGNCGHNTIGFVACSPRYAYMYTSLSSTSSVLPGPTSTYVYTWLPCNLVTWSENVTCCQATWQIAGRHWLDNRMWFWFA